MLPQSDSGDVKATDAPAEQPSECACIKTWFETAARDNTQGLGAEQS